MGLVAMAVAMKVGWRRLARFAYPLLMLTFVLLVLVLIPGVGTTAGGAQRWIRLPGFGLQPAEVAKFSWVVYLAYSAREEAREGGDLLGGLPAAPAAVRRLVLLCMKQPDFGSSVLLVFLLFVLLFAAGTKLSFLVGSVLLALPLAYYAVATAPTA